MGTDPIRLLVHGASGRMGRAVLRLAAQDPRFAVAAAVSRAGGDIEGAPGVATSNESESMRIGLPRWNWTLYADASRIVIPASIACAWARRVSSAASFSWLKDHSYG